MLHILGEKNNVSQTLFFRKWCTRNQQTHQKQTKWHQMDANYRIYSSYAIAVFGCFDVDMHLSNEPYQVPIIDLNYSNHIQLT